MESETSFRDKPIYPVLFILALSVLFVGILALMYRSNEPRIEAQKLEEYQKTVLRLCADSLANLTGLSAAEIVDGDFSEYIEPQTQASSPRKAFSAKYRGIVIARVFEVKGKGLWGTMRALVATTPDLQTLLGISVYEQSETPGLGGRIEEDWFTSQFKHKKILGTAGPVELELVPEGQADLSPDQVRQVTGATITSKAVIDMLRSELASIAAQEVKP